MRKNVQQILQLALQIERSYQSTDGNLDKGGFDKDTLEELCQLILHLQETSDPQLQRLSTIARHLNEQMNLKHFVGFMVPFERYLNKSLQDDDFLTGSGASSFSSSAAVLTQDQPERAVERIPLVVILDNIRSAFNVGSIFRTAETLGAEKIILTGYTCTPEDDRMLKTSMGSAQFMDWSHYLHLEDALFEVLSNGYELVALETVANGLTIYDKKLPKKCALIMGNERFGIEESLLENKQFFPNKDHIRKIPMRGIKNSLNVGVAFSVAGFEWARQWDFL
jgi:23S rRNA (guanosine2251-2'-O)-methyltransferase